MSDPTLKVDRSLIPNNLNEEEKDFIKAASKAQRSPHDHVPAFIYQLISSAFEKGPASDLGHLSRFPLEVLTEIVSSLDITSCLRLRQVNKRSRQLVTNAPKYRFVVENAPAFFGHVLRLGVGSWLTLSDAVHLLSQGSCEKCDTFTTSVFLPEWERLCNDCRRTTVPPRVSLVSKSRTASILNMSPKRLEGLVPIMRIPKERRQWCSTRSLVAVSSVKKLCTEIKLSRPVELIHSLLDAAPTYPQVPQYAPFSDKVVGRADYGVECHGSRLPFSTRPERGHGQFSASEFYLHSTSCTYAQKIKEKMEKAAQVDENEEGWIWIEDLKD